MIKINDNKNVFSSIVCEVNRTVFFFINIISVFFAYKKYLVDC